MKICKYCNKTGNVELFRHNRNQCLDCKKVYDKKYRTNNRPKAYLARKIWASKPENKKKDDISKLKWRNNNKEKEKAYRNNKRKINMHYRLGCNLRHRLWMALNGKAKSDHTLNLLGCSLESFKKHLENQFLEGMSWENYGRNGWHMGHIYPCAFFDLNEPIQQKVCFNYQNMRPEWETENITNSAKMPDGRDSRKINLEEKGKILKELIEKFEI